MKLMLVFCLILASTVTSSSRLKSNIVGTMGDQSSRLLPQSPQSLGIVCADREVLVPRTDGGLIPPAFCYPFSDLYCQVGNGIQGCTSCHGDAKPVSITVEKNGYRGVTNGCPSTKLARDLIIILVGGALLIIILLIVCCCCCCCKKQQPIIINQGYPGPGQVYVNGQPSYNFNAQPGTPYQQNPNDSYQSLADTPYSKQGLQRTDS